MRAGGDGAQLVMLVLHDDAKREYAYGTAAGLSDTKVGAFAQELYDEAAAEGWTVVSVKKRLAKDFCLRRVRISSLELASLTLAAK